jgi:predicted Ser/Thr protein kinase
VKVPGVGDEFAGYRIESLLGKGGMGLVYKARHLGLDRPVALKLLPEDLTDDDSFRARFERESRLAAGMEHPNIIPIYEAGEHEQLLYIVMRYVNGSDLKQLIKKENALAPDRSLALVAQAASALDAAHSTELVHRDVKPHNMLVAPETGWSQEHLYLTDFGLAKKTSSSAAITATGSFMGTIFYVAPEQIQGTRDVGPQVDVYSLGCVFYECLTGQVPFDGDSDMEIIGAHLNAEPPRPSRHGLPAGLDDVIRTAMAKDPAERYPLGTTMVMDARDVLAEAGWEVSAMSGLSGDARTREERVDTLTAPAPLVDTGGGLPPTVPTPQFRFGKKAAPLTTPQAMGEAPAQRRRRRRGWLLPVVTILAVAAAAAFSYRALFDQSEEGQSQDVAFTARATSEIPAELPRRIGDFALAADKSELIDVLPGFEKLLGGGYQNNVSLTFVNHYVVLYETRAEAQRDLNDQIEFLESNGFEITEESPLRNAAGAIVGDVVLMDRDEPRNERALAWTNRKLSVGARGAAGPALEFFNSSEY